MTLKLLVRKLYLDKSRFVKSSEIREYCKKLGLDYYTAIRYLLSNKYLIRILRGIFYKVSFEERRFKRTDINHLEAAAEALKLKNIKRWYFGLETAMKLNSITHEYFAVDYVVSDALFRARPIIIMGHKVKFVKLKKSLFSFGIRKNVSENEKTLLDMVYLSKYSGYSNHDIKSRISGLISRCSKGKLVKYSKKYNKEVSGFIRQI